MEEGEVTYKLLKSDKDNVERHVKGFRSLCKVALFFMESPITHCDNVCNMTTLVIQAERKWKRKKIAEKRQTSKKCSLLLSLGVNGL